MSDSRLGTTLVAALALDTLGAVAPFAPVPILLPSPRQYLATWLLWFALGLVAATGQRAARAAGQLSVLVLLTMAVVGPFGRRAIRFLEGVAGFFPAPEGGTA